MEIEVRLHGVDWYCATVLSICSHTMRILVTFPNSPRWEDQWFAYDDVRLIKRQLDCFIPQANSIAEAWFPGLDDGPPRWILGTILVVNEQKKACFFQYGDPLVRVMKPLDQCRSIFSTEPIRGDLLKTIKVVIPSFFADQMFLTETLTRFRNDFNLMRVEVEPGRNFVSYLKVIALTESAAMVSIMSMLQGLALIPLPNIENASSKSLPSNAPLISDKEQLLRMKTALHNSESDVALDGKIIDLNADSTITSLAAMPHSTNVPLDNGNLNSFLNDDIILPTVDKAEQKRIKKQEKYEKFKAKKEEEKLKARDLTGVDNMTTATTTGPFSQSLKTKTPSENVLSENNNEELRIGAVSTLNSNKFQKVTFIPTPIVGLLLSKSVPFLNTSLVQYLTKKNKVDIRAETPINSDSGGSFVTPIKIRGSSLSAVELVESELKVVEHQIFIYSADDLRVSQIRQAEKQNPNDRYLRVFTLHSGTATVYAKEKDTTLDRCGGITGVKSRLEELLDWKSHSFDFKKVYNIRSVILPHTPYAPNINCVHLSIVAHRDHIVSFIQHVESLVSKIDIEFKEKHAEVISFKKDQDKTRKKQKKKAKLESVKAAAAAAAVDGIKSKKLNVNVDNRSDNINGNIELDDSSNHFEIESSLISLESSLSNNIDLKTKQLNNNCTSLSIRCSGKTAVSIDNSSQSICEQLNSSTQHRQSSYSTFDSPSNNDLNNISSKIITKNIKESKTASQHNSSLTVTQVEFPNFKEAEFDNTLDPLPANFISPYHHVLQEKNLQCDLIREVSYFDDTNNNTQSSTDDGINLKKK